MMGALVAERLKTLRGTTLNRLHCAGCQVMDSKAKLVVARMGNYHPACYREMVAKWRT